jgi:predicted PolB exonuclease-like 3'-5' exonuclease
MDLLALYQGRGNAPLDDLAKLIGFPGKLGMDGSAVWGHGSAERLRRYVTTAKPTCSTPSLSSSAFS